MMNLPNSDRPSGAERRRSHRIPLTRVVNSEALAEESAITVNVSTSGLCLVTPRKIEPGQKLELDLQLHEADLFPIKFQAVCCWTRVSESEPCTVGLDLQDTNPRSLSVLRKYLENFSPESEPEPMRIKTSAPPQGKTKAAAPRQLLEAFSGALHSLNEDSIEQLLQILSEEQAVRKSTDPDATKGKKVGSRVILELWLKSLLAQDPTIGTDLKEGLRRRKSFRD